MTTSDEKSRLKMHFSLKEHRDGWPPVSEETVWVKSLGVNLFEVDNVPFFVRLVAYKDQVEGDFSGKILNFRRLAKSSGYATIRVIYRDVAKKEELIRELESMCCEVEGAEQYSLISIGIPPGKNFEQAMKLIREGHRREAWDYEEGCLPPKSKKGWRSMFKTT